MRCPFECSLVPELVHHQASRSAPNGFNVLDAKLYEYYKCPRCLAEWNTCTKVWVLHEHVLEQVRAGKSPGDAAEDCGLRRDGPEARWAEFVYLSEIPALGVPCPVVREPYSVGKPDGH